MIRSILFLSILFVGNIFAHEESHLNSSDFIAQIFTEQPDSIEKIQKNKMYLKNERIFPTNRGLFLFNNHSMIPLPVIFSDNNGCYVECKNKSNEYAWTYKCTNRKCGRIWDASEGSKCPGCQSPGEIMY